MVPMRREGRSRAVRRPSILASARTHCRTRGHRANDGVVREGAEHFMMESATRFDCHGGPRVGILHRPANPNSRGILIVVGGGPQYRVGGHRQLVSWARRMTEQGYAVFRF